MNKTPNIYKLTNSAAIAHQVASGVFRFYELTKYIKIEDRVGRLDRDECALVFTAAECQKHSEKVPTASLGGIEFKAASFRPDEKYISQYFVFCMSIDLDAQAIKDSTHAVELSTDIFETIEMLLGRPERHSQSTGGLKFFSHGPVEYYDVHHQPLSLENEMWREAYLKRSEFEYQKEYRAALFVSDSFVDRIRKQSMVINEAVFREDGTKLPFDAKLIATSNIDADGWRYIELDISEFSANLLGVPSKVTPLVQF